MIHPYKKRKLSLWSCSRSLSRTGTLTELGIEWKVSLNRDRDTVRYFYYSPESESDMRQVAESCIAVAALFQSYQITFIIDQVILTVHPKSSVGAVEKELQSSFRVRSKLGASRYSIDVVRRYIHTRVVDALRKGSSDTELKRLRAGYSSGELSWEQYFLHLRSKAYTNFYDTLFYPADRPGEAARLSCELVKVTCNYYDWLLYENSSVENGEQQLVDALSNHDAYRKYLMVKCEDLVGYLGSLPCSEIEGAIRSIDDIDLLGAFKRKIDPKSAASREYLVEKYGHYLSVVDSRRAFLDPSLVVSAILKEINKEKRMGLF